MVNITLLGEPRSTGSIYKSRTLGKFSTIYMTHGGKALKESYQWQAKAQHRGQATDKPLKVVMRLYFGTKRKADIDNFNKLCFDSLTGIVWVDDSQVGDFHITKGYDKENPRIELEIDEL